MTELTTTATSSVSPEPAQDDRYRVTQLYNDGKGTMLTLEYRQISDLDFDTAHTVILSATYMGMLKETSSWDTHHPEPALYIFTDAINKFFKKVDALDKAKTETDVADWAERFLTEKGAKMEIASQLADKMGFTEQAAEETE